MGRGIAYVCAVNGYNVFLNDVSENSLETAKKHIQTELENSEARGFLEKGIASEAQNRITYTPNLEEAVADVELAIEAVFEKMDLKIEIFKRLDQLTKPSTVLATNTSTMSPTEIGAQTNRPDKCVALHFFNPVHKMKLIEIIKGLDTSEETTGFVEEFGKSIKKETVLVSEFPGFVTSRMNCLIGNEAMNLLMEGVASAEDIDKAMKLGLNHPMGPLELADLVGLDSRLRNMEYLHKTLGEKYRPCPLLIKYVKAGRLGKKSGSGFYEYN